MNFSLKKGPTKRARVAFDEEPAEKKAREIVSEVQESSEFQIKLGSNRRWLKDAALQNERAEACAPDNSDEEDTLKEPEEIQRDIPRGSQIGKTKDELVFEQDMQRRPDAPKSEVYEQISVADFGAALLRGIGLDPNEKPQKSQRDTGREGLLGVGAKGAQSGGRVGRKDAFNIAIPVKPASKHPN